ncbi:MAG: hypothetical protein PQJ58_15055 [Spirochaetales bacterium]|nr:hypothetical protein [Spirochaetales bacterium]
MSLNSDDVYDVIETALGVEKNAIEDTYENGLYKFGFYNNHGVRKVIGITPSCMNDMTDGWVYNKIKESEGLLSSSSSQHNSITVDTFQGDSSESILH